VNLLFFENDPAFLSLHLIFKDEEVVYRGMQGPGYIMGEFE
jgi:hypothetical protein